MGELIRSSRSNRSSRSSRSRSFASSASGCEAETAARSRRKAITFADVLLERQAEFRTPGRRSSRDTARANALSFIRFSDRRGLEIHHARLGRTSARRGHEAGHLVAGKQCLLRSRSRAERRNSRRADRMAARHPGRVAATRQFLTPAERSGRPPSDIARSRSRGAAPPRPSPFHPREPSGIAADRRFDRQRMLSQALARRPLGSSATPRRDRRHSAPIEYRVGARGVGAPVRAPARITAVAFSVR